MTDTIDRREFVRLGACAGLGLAVLGPSGCASAQSDSAAVETPSSSFGGGTEMSKRVLVGYGTRTGSTVGVAEAIGEALAQRGWSVDVKPLREHPPLAGYDAAVLGSAVNGGQWLPEAMGYVEANRGVLAKIPVAAFCVHIMNAGPEDKATKRRHAYLDKVRAAVKLTDEGYFLGKGPTAEDSALIMRWAFKAFGGSGEGDCRDWDQIRTWAGQLSV